MSLTTRNYGTPTAPRGSAQTPAHWAWCRPTTESGCEHWTWCPTVLSQRRKGSPNAHLAALVSVDPEFRPIAESLSGLRSRSKTDQDADGTPEVSPTAATRPPARSGRGALAGAVGHRHRPGVPLRRSSRQPRNEAPERPGRRSHGQAPRARSRSRRRVHRSLAASRLRHRGLRPRNTRLAIMRHGRWRSAAVIPATSGGSI